MLNMRLTVVVLHLIGIGRIFADLTSFKNTSVPGKDSYTNDTSYARWDQKQSAPRYLMELYRQRYYNTIRSQRDTITAFFPEGEGRETLLKVNHVLYFNLRDALLSNLKEAKLRVLKKRATEVKNRKCPLYTIRLYIIFGNNEEQLDTSKPETLLGITAAKNSMKGQWLEFDVSSAVQMLELNQETSLGFRFSVEGELCAEFHIGNKGRHRPFLLTFTRNAIASREEFVSIMGPRSINANALKIAVNAVKMRKIRDVDRRHCQRRRFKVHFHELKWNNWIIAPSSYWANYCDGKCPRVLGNFFSPSNHAILQNILHYGMDKKIPRASCVPTKLHPLPVVYYNKAKSIVLTTLNEMTVSSCGCR